MYQFVESISYQRGKFKRLKYHSQRINRVRKEVFGNNVPIDLRAILAKVSKPKSLAHHKCRYLYNDTQWKVEFIRYSNRKIEKLKVVDVNESYTYSHKSLDRAELDGLFAARKSADDILIFRGEWLTDAYYYNVVIKYNDHLYTPEKPLLKGTMRQFLLDRGIISTMNISKDILKASQKILLINALNPLGRIMIPSEQVEY